MGSTSHTDPKLLSVFLLSPDAGGHAGLPHEPMLDAGQTRVAGKVWFVSPAVVAGRAKVLETLDSAEIFRIVSEELELGDVPAVIVDPRSSRTEIRYYPKGLGYPDECRTVPLHLADMDVQQISNVIETVYRQCLITPDAQPQGNKLWSNPGKHWPFSNAEHKIQAYLKPAFATAYPTCRVYDEFAGTMGRADLHIEEPDPLNREVVTYLAVLELKVLRSYSDKGGHYPASQSKQAVEDGVRQAGSYRKERGHRVAALCCFDMRQEDTGGRCFEEVRDLATDLAVALRRWYLYASSKLAREAGAPNDRSPE